MSHEKLTFFNWVSGFVAIKFFKTSNFVKTKFF